MSPKTTPPVLPDARAQSEAGAEMLSLFKAMADATRLRIIGLLANRPHSVEQLAAELDLGSSTVSHHLARLSAAGLVSARAQSYYNVYSLETAGMERVAREVLSRAKSAPELPEFEGPAADRKVLDTYLLPDGTLKVLPAQHKKRLVILRHALKGFEPGKRYSEKQVNEVLKAFSKDHYVTLRRYLIDCGFMGREGGGREYWRVE